METPLFKELVSSLKTMLERSSLAISSAVGMGVLVSRMIEPLCGPVNQTLLVSVAQHEKTASRKPKDIIFFPFIISCRKCRYICLTIVENGLPMHLSWSRSKNQQMTNR